MKKVLFFERGHVSKSSSTESNIPEKDEKLRREEHVVLLRRKEPSPFDTTKLTFKWLCDSVLVDFLARRLTLGIMIKCVIPFFPL